MPENGDLVFIDGNKAAIVIGEGVGNDGTPDGSIIVATFAGAQQIERGHYGSSPSVAGENPPSFVPEGTVGPAPQAGQVVVPSAGDADTPDATTDATQDTGTQQASDGGVLDVGGIAPGNVTGEPVTAMTAEQAQSERESDQDARIADLQRQLAEERSRSTSTAENRVTAQSPQGDAATTGADLGGVATGDATAPPASTPDGPATGTTA